MTNQAPESSDTTFDMESFQKGLPDGWRWGDAIAEAVSQGPDHTTEVIRQAITATAASLFDGTDIQIDSGNLHAFYGRATALSRKLADMMTFLALQGSNVQ